MALKLPKKLPTSHSVSSIKRPSGITRAQDLSVSKLQDRIDRSKAAVSMGQVAHREGRKRGAKTSIGRVGSFAEATSSIMHAKETAGSLKKHEYESLYDEDADERRYEYIRRKVTARRAKERKEGDKFFNDLIYKNTKQSAADAKLGYRDRVKLKVDIDKAKMRGSISNEMAGKYKRRIDKMV